MLSAGCQGDWLTLEEFSHIVQSNMMSSREGKLKEEREGGLLILDQEEVSHFTYNDTHPQSLTKW
jgi:hypothetical protein